MTSWSIQINVYINTAQSIGSKGLGDNTGIAEAFVENDFEIDNR